MAMDCILAIRGYSDFCVGEQIFQGNVGGLVVRSLAKNKGSGNGSVPEDFGFSLNSALLQRGTGQVRSRPQHGQGSGHLGI